MVASLRHITELHETRRRQQDQHGAIRMMLQWLLRQLGEGMPIPELPLGARSLQQVRVMGNGDHFTLCRLVAAAHDGRVSTVLAIRLAFRAGLFLAFLSHGLVSIRGNYRLLSRSTQSLIRSSWASVLTISS